MGEKPQGMCSVDVISPLHLKSRRARVLSEVRATRLAKKFKLRHYPIFAVLAFVSKIALCIPIGAEY